MFFRNVDLEEFVQTVETLALTPALRRAWDRLDHRMIFSGPPHDETICIFHEGDLHIAGDFRAPAYHVLVLGDVIADGIVDTNFDAPDEGGSFIVTGRVHCRNFLNHYGKTAVIGGDLTATDVLFNAFEETLLYVGGSIATHFYYGWDAWAEFGTAAAMEYGLGYCLPLNYSHPSTQAIRPRFDEATSLKHLAVADAGNRSNDEILDFLKSGKPIFR